MRLQPGSFAMPLKHLLLVGLVLCISTSALPEARLPPELQGIPVNVQGAQSRRLAFEYFKSAPDAVFAAYHTTLAPGASVASHTHSGPEYHYVAAGELQETVGGAARTLRTGEGNFIPAGTPHELRNAGSQPAQLIVFIAGVKDQQLTTPFSGTAPKGR
jgi:quercetin dioxygenase-like cupin family protein